MAKLVDLNTLAYFATLVRDYINDCFLRQKKGVEIGWFDFSAIVPDPPLENMNDAFIRFSEIGKVFAGSVGEWDEKTSYSTGTWVTYNKALWRLTSGYTASSSDSLATKNSRIPGATSLWVTPSVSIPGVGTKPTTLKSLGEYCDAIKKNLNDFITETNENIETLRGGINTLNEYYNGLTTLKHANCVSESSANTSNLHLLKRGHTVAIHGYFSSTSSFSSGQKIARIPIGFAPDCHTADDKQSYVTLVGVCPTQNKSYAVDVKRINNDYYLMLSEGNSFSGGNLYLNGCWMISTIDELKGKEKKATLIKPEEIV